MKLILGIDTGGTYTDSVIMTADTKQLLYKAKTLTTKDDLCSCIQTTFYSIPTDYLKSITMVCLSTTLATNAIVEDRGCKEGLILIGKRPKGMMPTDRYEVIDGLFDIKGRLKRPINEAELDGVIERFRGKVDAIAVSGYASIRNPAHEIHVAESIREKLNIPVVCAHELASSLGYYQRTITADLNARLIPMVCTLMDAVRMVMDELQVFAPLMIVKSDGSLMTDACARNKPIETILSGPAASVMGAIFLSGKKDAFVMDIGGTTTDIANVEEGHLNIRSGGARVGNWDTHVRAVEVYTTGLGGDSRICLNSNRALVIGPEKSIPYCQAVCEHPELLREVAEILVYEYYQHFCHQDEEAYVLLKKEDDPMYSDSERKLVDELRKKPHTLYYLEERLCFKNVRNTLKSLLHLGIVGRVSLTPTDILHVEGSYRKWDWKVSEMVVSILAKQMRMTNKEFTKQIHEQVTECLYRNAMQGAFYFDDQNFDVQRDPAVEYFLEHLHFRSNSRLLSAVYHLDKTIVAIGAPSIAWFCDLEEQMQTEVIVPEHAEVANAVGAAVGKSVEKIEILIRQDSVCGRYIVYSPLDRNNYETLEEATEYAKRTGETCIEQMAEQRKYVLKTECNDTEIEDVTNGKKVFVERLVTVMALFENCEEERIDSV